MQEKTPITVRSRYLTLAGRKAATRQFIKHLLRLADTADELELTLPNGGLVGCNLFTMAHDIEQSLGIASLPDEA